MARQKSYEETVKPKLDLIKAWTKNGLSNNEVAYNLGINAITLKKYADMHSELAYALTVGRDEADALVENALFLRATGYTYFEKTWERKFDTETATYKLVLQKKVEKHVMPDTTAQITWLTNRKPRTWRVRPEQQDRQDGNSESIKAWLTATAVGSTDIINLFGGPKSDKNTATRETRDKNSTHNVTTKKSKEA